MGSLSIPEPLLRRMHVASEIVVPTVCVLSILIAALLLTLLRATAEM